MTQREAREKIAVLDAKMAATAQALEAARANTDPRAHAQAEARFKESRDLYDQLAATVVGISDAGLNTPEAGQLMDQLEERVNAIAASWEQFA